MGAPDRGGGGHVLGLNWLDRPVEGGERAIRSRVVAWLDFVPVQGQARADGSEVELGQAGRGVSARRGGEAGRWRAAAILLVVHRKAIEGRFLERLLVVDAVCPHRVVVLVLGGNELFTQAQAVL